jgi:hypothetical protein
MALFKCDIGTRILHRCELQNDLNELGKIRKELVVAYFKVFCLTYSEQLNCLMICVLFAKYCWGHRTEKNKMGRACCRCEGE